jgi:hypothetical protein
VSTLCFCAVVNVFTVFALGVDAACFAAVPATGLVAGLAGLAGFACNGLAGAFLTGAAGVDVFEGDFDTAF